MICSKFIVGLKNKHSASPYSLPSLSLQEGPFPGSSPGAVPGAAAPEALAPSPLLWELLWELQLRAVGFCSAASSSQPGPDSSVRRNRQEP